MGDKNALDKRQIAPLETTTTAQPDTIKYTVEDFIHEVHKKAEEVWNGGLGNEEAGDALFRITNTMTSNPEFATMTASLLIYLKQLPDSIGGIDAIKREFGYAIVQTDDPMTSSPRREYEVLIWLIRSYILKYPPSDMLKIKIEDLLHQMRDTNIAWQIGTMIESLGFYITPMYRPIC